MRRPSATEIATPTGHAAGGQRGGLVDGEPDDVAARRAEGDPHTDFVGALRHHVGHHSVDPDHCQHQRDATRRDNSRQPRRARNYSMELFWA